MTSVIVIDKGGVSKEITVKLNNKDNITQRYSPKSKLGKSGFEKKTVWNIKINQENYVIELWATDKGRAGSENKYDFPPPVDSELYFGSCLLLRVENDGSDVIDLTKKDWNQIYEKLFGGFEDIGSEEPSEDELESIPDDMKTNTGYLKDGFVVDNDDSEEIDSTNSEEEAVSSIGDDEDEDEDDVKGVVNDGNDEDDEDDEDEDDVDNSELDSEDYHYDSE